jgi:hypothetical protein
MGTLKLTGVRTVHDGSITGALKRPEPLQQAIGVLQAQLVENRARSTAYRMGKVRFPLGNALAELDFAVSPVNEAPVRDLHEDGFLAIQRNAVFCRGTGARPVPNRAVRSPLTSPERSTFEPAAQLASRNSLI